MVSWETFDAAQRAEAAFWSDRSWQNMPKERRVSEWRRHLADLGLSTCAFVNDRLLDVGCGPTGLAYFVDAKRRVGLDPLAHHYEQWNGHWGEQIELVAGQGEAMPFDDASFDTVVCVNCVDHTRDPSRVVDEIARVLRVEGSLIFHVDFDSPLRRLHKRVRPHVGRMHPHTLSYDWVKSRLAGSFEVLREHRDREVFRPTWQQLSYEAFWDGVMYKATRSRSWMNHIWLLARRR